MTQGPGAARWSAKEKRMKHILGEAQIINELFAKARNHYQKEHQ